MMNTPRQELVIEAADKLNYWRSRNRPTRTGQKKLSPAHDALEAVIDECRAFGKGTIGAAMRHYYLRCSDRALTRLINEVSIVAQAKRGG